MDEQVLQIIVSMKVVILAMWSYCYGRGGIWNKSIRRYIGTALLVVGYVGFSLLTDSFSWYYLICYPLLIGATSIGYGADETFIKVIKRTYCGLAYSCAALPIFFVTNNWLMFALHTVLCLSTSVLLGVINPVDARHEETLIGLTIGLIPMFTV